MVYSFHESSFRVAERLAAPFPLKIAEGELMNRPRKPPFPMQNRRKPTPAKRTPTTGGGMGPRRRSPLDQVPPNAEPRFRILGSGIDRGPLMTHAQPMEMLVIHGWTNEIERAFADFHGRPDDFWQKRPDMLEQARKLDEVLAGIQERKNAPK